MNIRKAKINNLPQILQIYKAARDQIREKPRFRINSQLLFP